MSNELNRSNKPSNPAPPLNALQKPAVKKQEPVVRRSVYDEIAERRKREKHKIGVSSHDSFQRDEQPERRYYLGDEIDEILDDIKQSKTEDKTLSEPPVIPESEPEKAELPEGDDDVKVYIPSSGEDIFSATQKLPVEEILDQNVEYTYPRDNPEEYNEDNMDVLPVPTPKKRVGVWVALISVLSGLCVIAAGAYGVVNGYFDGIISML